MDNDQRYRGLGVDSRTYTVFSLCMNDLFIYRLTTLLKFEHLIFLDPFTLPSPQIVKKTYVEGEIRRVRFHFTFLFSRYLVLLLLISLMSRRQFRLQFVVIIEMSSGTPTEFIKVLLSQERQHVSFTLIISSRLSV